jgi:hypothetical protein
MRTRLKHIARLLRGSVALATGLVIVIAGSVTAGEPSEPLSTIGSGLETALSLPPAERAAALTQLDGRMTAFLKGDFPADQKAAARFLVGEIQFAMGQYDAAGKAYREAAKEAKKQPLASDAELAAIQTLEARRGCGEGVGKVDASESGFARAAGSDAGARMERRPPGQRLHGGLDSDGRAARLPVAQE